MVKEPKSAQSFLIRLTRVKNIAGVSALMAVWGVVRTYSGEAEECLIDGIYKTAYH